MCVIVIVNFGVCNLQVCLSYVTECKWSINLATKPNPVSSHTSFMTNKIDNNVTTNIIS
jgi:hypothetical protein